MIYLFKSHLRSLSLGVLTFSFQLSLCFAAGEEGSSAPEPSGKICKQVAANLGRGLSANDAKGATAWMAWNCTSCGREANTARPNADGSVRCACGNSRNPSDARERFYWPAGQGKVRRQDIETDIQRIRLASSTKAAECPSCSSQVLIEGGRTICPSCGDVTDWTNIVESRIAARPPTNDESNPPEVLSPAAQYSSSPETLSSRYPTRNERFTSFVDNNRSFFKRAAWAVAAALALGGGTALTIWGLQPVEYTGEVSSMSWEHRVEIDRFTQVTESAWENDIRARSPVMPVNGIGGDGGVFNIRNHRREIHHYDQHLIGYRTETYTEQVPHTTYETETDYEWQDNGNGSATSVPVTRTVPRTTYTTEMRTREVPEYEQVPVYATRVDYDTYEWQQIRTMREQGGQPVGSEPLAWPNPVLNSLERSRRESEYHVTLTFDRPGNRKDIDQSIEPSTEAEFRNFFIGEDHMGRFNKFGMFLDYHSTEQPE